MNWNKIKTFWNKIEGQRTILVVSVILLASFIILGTLSYTVLKDITPAKYAVRVIARGLIGILSCYHAFLMLFTSKKYYLTKNSNRKQNRFSGILLGFVGLGMVLTAIAGYGINGDPRLFWWQ